MQRVKSLFMMAAVISAIILPGCVQSQSDEGAFPREENEHIRENGDSWFQIVTTDITGDISLRAVTDAIDLPNESGWLVSMKNGSIAHVVRNNDALELAGVFSIPTAWYYSDCGLISMALDPKWQENGLLYVGHCNNMTSSSISVVEINLNSSSYIVSGPATVLTVGHENATHAWHNIGSIGFDQWGYMWALFGEKNIKSEAQDTSNMLGSLIRFEAIKNTTSSGAIPIGFGNASDTYHEMVFSWGLRSPWKGVMDSHGRWWIGDVGGGFEEVNIATGMENFGWPISYGGPCCCGSPCIGKVEPIIWWNRSSEHPYTQADPYADDNEGALQTVWIGPIISNQTNQTEEEFVLFGDFFKGWVRAIKISHSGAVLEHYHVGHISNPTGWVKDGDDWLVFSYGETAWELSDNRSTILRMQIVWD